MITAEFVNYFLVTVYTPNSGEGLARLDYRERWDTEFTNYLQWLKKRKPVIVCGDFNDEFTDRSIRDGLRASNSPDEVRGNGAEPRLLDLFANWAGDPPGTIYGRSHWSVFDHICVTRGLLDDKGWSCDVPTAAIFAAPEMRTASRRGRFEPFRFGNQKASGPRGYSDHFPVTVMLKVAGSAAP